jgi:formate dehydrogenase assembly factor FdhD
MTVIAVAVAAGIILVAVASAVISVAITVARKRGMFQIPASRNEMPQ